MLVVILSSSIRQERTTDGYQGMARTVCVSRAIPESRNARSIFSSSLAYHCANSSCALLPYIVSRPTSRFAFPVARSTMVSTIKWIQRVVHHFSDNWQVAEFYASYLYHQRTPLCVLSGLLTLEQRGLRTQDGYALYSTASMCSSQLLQYEYRRRHISARLRLSRIA